MAKYFSQELYVLLRSINHHHHHCKHRACQTEDAEQDLLRFRRLEDQMHRRHRPNILEIQRGVDTGDGDDFGHNRNNDDSQEQLQ